MRSLLSLIWGAVCMSAAIYGVIQISLTPGTQIALSICCGTTAAVGFDMFWNGGVKGR